MVLDWHIDFLLIAYGLVKISLGVFEFLRSTFVCMHNNMDRYREV